MVLYRGRECVMPWELEGDLGPLQTEVDLPVEKVIDRMYNIREQALDVAAANIKRAQKIQSRSYNAKHCRNTFEVSEKVWRKNPLWNTKQKSLKKGPKWYGPNEVAERKDDGNGNYLLKSLSGRNKGQISQEILPSKPPEEVHPQKPRFLVIVIPNMDLIIRTVSQLHKTVL